MTNTHEHRIHGCRLLEAFLFAGLMLGGLAACAGEPAPAADDGTEAAVLQVIEGQEVSRITLTAKASERLGVTIEAVEARTTEGKLQVPYGALLYDASGATWVYTNPEPLVFVRAPVAVERIEGSSVRLTSGPEPGTNIVTVGAAELLGAELDTAH
ncbi:hypothetical protein FHJ30_03475 [Arthrobacter sp. BB-1]|uniref:hypothetical protein n=1 Tax=unclassified Arthrobacter TaxID=235627 RepID=UPI001112138D|nr:MULTISPECIES: hypothetical protein [unclassified Arthrobacter]TNB75712.1 hypothetical protein FHJ30_03475 [Arthrobacter sp. BB-1]